MVWLGLRKGKVLLTPYVPFPLLYFYLQRICYWPRKNLTTLRQQCARPDPTDTKTWGSYPLVKEFATARTGVWFLDLLPFGLMLIYFQITVNRLIGGPTGQWTCPVAQTFSPLMRKDLPREGLGGLLGFRCLPVVVLMNVCSQFGIPIR
jgi:hypothetical protein